MWDAFGFSGDRTSQGTTGQFGSQGFAACLGQFVVSEDVQDAMRKPV
jgi:hypothetical protein